MKVYKHIVFNPNYYSLKKIIEEMESEDCQYKLNSVVSITLFEWVAIFEKELPLLSAEPQKTLTDIG